MKNIGIVTITGGSNYGNRLQNYALQHYIEENFECTIATLKNESQTLSSIIKKILVKEQETKKAQRFKEFNKKYINFSKLSINNFTKSKDILDYDVLICGSDQIWNSSFRENDRANFGYFYPQQFVISYAASFGTEKVDSSKKRKYKKYLKHLKYISVREDSGKKIVKELTNNDDVEVLVDPTMLLAAEDYLKIASKECPCEKYLFIYFLGTRTNINWKEIHRFAKKKNLRIVSAAAAALRQLFRRYVHHPHDRHTGTAYGGHLQKRVHFGEAADMGFINNSFFKRCKGMIISFPVVIVAVYHY